MSRFIIVLMLMLSIVTSSLFADDEKDVQSLMLRGVIVTYELEASLQFYRDIMGQEVAEWVELDTLRSQSWLDISDQAEVVHIIFRGSAEYPGGPITGGRMSLIGIDDPERPTPAIEPGRGVHGDVIFPHRVANIDEIYRRIQAADINVLYPPRESSTGLSRSMMVYDPNGKIIEMFELFNTKKPQED